MEVDMNTLADYLYKHYDDIKFKRILLTNEVAIDFNHLAENQKYGIDNKLVVGTQHGTNNETRTVVRKYYLPIVTQDGKVNNHLQDYVEIAHNQLGFEKREIEVLSFKIFGQLYPVKEQGVSKGNANDEIIIDLNMVRENKIENGREK